MANDKELATAKQLEKVAIAAKSYHLRNIGSASSTVTGDIFTGATAIAGGTSGMVPAPSAGDNENFLCGNGTWATVASGGGNVFTGATSNTAGLSGLVPAPAAGDNAKVLFGDGTWKLLATGGEGSALPTVASAIEGSLWQDKINDTPVLKLRHGDYEYNFNYDGMTYMGSAASEVVTVTPDLYVLGSESSTVDGGVWYEVANDVPKIFMHNGAFNYSFNYDTITYVGGNKNLVSFLPFDSSTTADACGVAWTLKFQSDENTFLDTENKKFGAASLKLNNGGYLQAENVIDLTASAWTFDCWARLNVYDDCVAWLGSNTRRNGNGVRIGAYGVDLNTSSATLPYTNDPINSVWHHFAVTRSNDKLYCFVDGVLFGAKDIPDNFIDGSAFSLGPGAADMNLDNVRFFQGVALWTENFTPPTAEDYLR